MRSVTPSPRSAGTSSRPARAATTRRSPRPGRSAWAIRTPPTAPPPTDARRMSSSRRRWRAASARIPDTVLRMSEVTPPPPDPTPQTPGIPCRLVPRRELEPDALVGWHRLDRAVPDRSRSRTCRRQQRIRTGSPDPRHRRVRADPHPALHRALPRHAAMHPRGRVRHHRDPSRPPAHRPRHGDVPWSDSCSEASCCSWSRSARERSGSPFAQPVKRTSHRRSSTSKSPSATDRSSSVASACASVPSGRRTTVIPVTVAIGQRARGDQPPALLESPQERHVLGEQRVREHRSPRCPPRACD